MVSLGPLQKSSSACYIMLCYVDSNVYRFVSQFVFYFEL